MKASAQRVTDLRERHKRETHEHGYRVAERRALLADKIEQARQEEQRRKALEPAKRAIGIVWSFADPELVGRALVADRLTPSQGEDLLGLANERAEHGLSGRKRRRYETLIEQAADAPGLFEQARKAREAEQAAEARGALDRGPIVLPPEVSDWLFDRRDGSLTAADAGVLVAVLCSIERGVSCFARSEVDGDRIVLDPAGSIQLLPSMDGNRGASCRDSLRYLADLELLELGTEDGTGRTTVARGEQLRKQAELADSLP